MTNAQAAGIGLCVIVAGLLAGVLAGGRYEAAGNRVVLDTWTGTMRLVDAGELRASQ